MSTLVAVALSVTAKLFVLKIAAMVCVRVKSGYMAFSTRRDGFVSCVCCG